MLRAVVGEHPLHLLHPGNQEHIGKENHHADDALHQIQGKVTIQPAVKKTSDDHGQQEKQQDGQAKAHSHGNPHHGLLEFLVSQLFFQPPVKFGRLLLHFLGG